MSSAWAWREPRQHHRPVLVLLERAAELVGNLPDERDLVLKPLRSHLSPSSPEPLGQPLSPRSCAHGMPRRVGPRPSRSRVGLLIRSRRTTTIRAHPVACTTVVSPTSPRPTASTPHCGGMTQSARRTQRHRECGPTGLTLVDPRVCPVVAGPRSRDRGAMTQYLDTTTATPAPPQRRDLVSGGALIAGAAFFLPSGLLHPEPGPGTGCSRSTRWSPTPRGSPPRPWPSPPSPASRWRSPGSRAPPTGSAGCSAGVPSAPRPWPSASSSTSSGEWARTPWPATRATGSRRSCSSPTSSSTRRGASRSRRSRWSAGSVADCSAE